MMSDIKRQIGTGIPSNIEDNPQREGKEHVKAIALRPSKDEDEFVSFLNLFKTLNVNLPLIELIEKVPKYTKF
ncbi:acidic leucine-rich nuclear phosphoprotein 32 family member B-like [Gossypium australe]|uniref:Acidic leucine-rich nuclear phosphoprotein 32 family member B-like n=1 Tax=Gossypium australe TaxID=47621 RepID=A0A5B6UXA5_9ROSI|nr:acidic leucine-rich nuclear phosphoprotein 32 family member B-like [Gossypium australe]